LWDLTDGQTSHLLPGFGSYFTGVDDNGTVVPDQSRNMDGQTPLMAFTAGLPKPAEAKKQEEKKAA